MAAAEVIAFLRANTDEFTAKLDEAEAKMEAVSKAGGSNFDKLSSIGKYALLGIAGAAAGVAVASIDMADKYQAATNSIPRSRPTRQRRASSTSASPPPSQGSPAR